MDGTTKYINPLTDFGFKRIFGTEANKDLLIDFLETVLGIDGGIRELRYDNSEKQGRQEIDRKAIFDIYCITGKGEHIIVEMQNVRQEFFTDRVLYYATFPIQAQGEKGREWNFMLAPVYSVNIINFGFDDVTSVKNKYASYVQLIDRDDHRVFYDKLTFVFLELTRFTKTADELTTDFERWMYVLKNLSKLHDLPEALRKRLFPKLFRVAEIAKMTPQDRKYYDKSLKIYRDMYLIDNELKNQKAELKNQRAELKNQRAELINQRAELKNQKAELRNQEAELKRVKEKVTEQDAIIRNSVRILLEAGVALEKIAESTGLSIDEIEKIGKKRKGR